jgi:hypothetical protein
MVELNSLDLGAKRNYLVSHCARYYYDLASLMSKLNFI